MEGLVSKKNYLRIVSGVGGRLKAYICVQGEKSVVGLCTYCTKNDIWFHIWSHLLEKSLMENFTFCAVRHTRSFS